MTASPGLPAISCPTGLVAACAPLLGYQPADCVVGFIHGVPGRAGAVLVRVDLPAAEDAARVGAGLAVAIEGTRGSSVDLVAWIPAAGLPRRSQLPSVPVLTHLEHELTSRGIDVRTMLSTDGAMWWTHDCPYPGCCEDPVALEASVLDQIRAEFAYAGYAPLASREALAGRLAPDATRAAQVRRSLAGARPAGNPERWRDAQITFLTSLLVPGGPARAGSTGSRTRRDHGPLSAAVAARAIRGLADVAVRDTVLLRLIACPVTDREPWHRSIDLLCETVRCAPAGSAAPCATILAIVAWMTGEGALATVSLDRADADNPWYRLAELTREVIQRGIDPAQWRRGMAGLTEQECRGRAGEPG